MKRDKPRIDEDEFDFDVQFIEEEEQEIASFISEGEHRFTAGDPDDPPPTCTATGC
ncbi:hypothetical protein [Ktedonosporobacter rubrisoli]|uniref:hypothetical protein n=1 Tax=Ktedonosporobacter rubrisoli TaxID=2509675 RepID=UPI0013EEC350|nr:hypothetical protein [Ktedonosporobacter rubrisoli]